MLAQLKKKHSDSDFVFHRPDGSPWGDIGDSFNDLVVSAGLQKDHRPERLTPHSLRHTYASWLAIAGVSLRRNQGLLGHKSIITTERYSHLGENGLQPYYIELASYVSSGFVPRFVTRQGPSAAEKPPQVIDEKWWRRADSNRGPRDYETLESDFDTASDRLNDFDFEEDTLP